MYEALDKSAYRLIKHVKTQLLQNTSTHQLTNKIVITL